MIKQHLLSILCILYGFSAYSVFANVVDGKQDDHRIQDLQIQKQLDTIRPIVPNIPTYESKTPNKQEQTLSLSADELLAYPDLVVRAMAMAVLQNHFENVVFLLPYYQKIPQNMREVVLEEWAKGMVAEAQGDTKAAVKVTKYKNLLHF